MDKPVSVKHGSYTIKAGVLQGKPVARAFVTGGTRGVVEEATGASVDEAITGVKAALDARQAGEAAQRRNEPALGFAVPAEAEYARALSVIKPHEAHRRLLRAHALAGAEGLSAHALAFDAGYHSDGAATLQMGVIGREIAGALAIDLPATPPRKDADVALGVLAIAASGADGPVWIMHPELRAAVLAHKG